MNDAPKRRSRVQQEQPVERTGSHRSRRSRGGRKNGKALYYAVLVILVGVLVFSSVKIISYLKEQKDTERINDNQSGLHQSGRYRRRYRYRWRWHRRRQPGDAEACQEG